jgi:hypothetical protein
MSTYVSEEHAASIFRVEELAEQETSVKAGGKQACHLEALCSSETSVDFQRTKWRYILEYRTLHNHRCENLKSCILWYSLN